MMPDRFEIRDLLAEAVQLGIRGAYVYEIDDATRFTTKQKGFKLVRDGIRIAATDKPVVANIEIAKDPDDDNFGFFSVWVNNGEISDGPWVPFIQELIAKVSEEVATARSIKVADEISAANERKRIEDRNIAAMREKWAMKPVPEKR